MSKEERDLPRVVCVEINTQCCLKPAPGYVAATPWAPESSAGSLGLVSGGQSVLPDARFLAWKSQSSRPRQQRKVPCHLSQDTQQGTNAVLSSL